MAINPVQAVTLEALKGLSIGDGSRDVQILEARVTAMLSKTLARLDIAGQSVDVTTPRPLPVGTVLTLRAEQSSGQLKLIVQGQLPDAPGQPIASPHIRSAGAGIAESVRAALARIQPVPMQTPAPGQAAPAPQPPSGQAVPGGQGGAVPPPRAPSGEAAIPRGPATPMPTATSAPVQTPPSPYQVPVRTVATPPQTVPQPAQAAAQQALAGRLSPAPPSGSAGAQTTAPALPAQPGATPAPPLAVGQQLAVPAVPAQPGGAASPPAVPAAPPAAAPAMPARPVAAPQPAAPPPQARPAPDAGSLARPANVQAEQPLPLTPQALRGAPDANPPSAPAPQAGHSPPAQAAPPPPGAAAPPAQMAEAAASRAAAVAELAGRGQAEGIADPAAASPRPERLASMVFELPVYLAGNEAPLRLQVTREDEPQEEGEDAARSQSWTVRFASEAGRLGMVHAMISMIEGHIGVQLWAERQDTADLFKQGAAQLREALEASALKLDGINIAQGSPLGPD